MSFGIVKPDSPSLKTLQSVCPDEPIDDSDVGGCTCIHIYDTIRNILDEIIMINSDFVSASPSIYCV